MIQPPKRKMFFFFHWQLLLASATGKGSWIASICLFATQWNKIAPLKGETRGGFFFHPEQGNGGRGGERGHSCIIEHHYAFFHISVINACHSMTKFRVLQNLWRCVCTVGLSQDCQPWLRVALSWVSNSNFLHQGGYSMFMFPWFITYQGKGKTHSILVMFQRKDIWLMTWIVFSDWIFPNLFSSRIFTVSFVSQWMTWILMVKSQYTDKPRHDHLQNITQWHWIHCSLFHLILYLSKKVTPKNWTRFSIWINIFARKWQQQ